MNTNDPAESSVEGGPGRIYRNAGDQPEEIFSDQGSGLISMRALGHRSPAQILEVEESDEGVPEISRPPKNLRIPRRLSGGRT